MAHLLILVALLAFLGLDVMFVQYSYTAEAALTFAVLSFIILLLLSVSAGSFVAGPRDYTTFLGPLLGPGLLGFLARVLLSSFISVVLLLAVAYLPSLGNPAQPSETIVLGTAFAIFWLMMVLALVGAVLGFLWPRTGAFEAVVVGGLVVLAQSLLSWAQVGSSRDALQLQLYTWMAWLSVCLIGAWVGLTLRQISDHYIHQPQADQLEGEAGLAADSSRQYPTGHTLIEPGEDPP